MRVPDSTADCLGFDRSLGIVVNKHADLQTRARISLKLYLEC
jgi:hypothetical protein